SGPASATAGLFAGRPWVLCPTEGTTPATEAAVRDLAVACGGTPVVMSADEHDRSVALVSHLPHLAATVVAARLNDDAAAVAVSGPGLADTTRVAAGDPDLWGQILTGNAAFVAPVVRAAAADLIAVADAIEVGDVSAVHDLLARGQRGRALVPVKRGDHDADFTRLSVSVPDAPGQLAAVFGCAAEADVNIEDVRVEHLPGRPTGLLELLVHVGERARLRTALEGAGFTVLPDAES
ncbi:MAG: prephenate dehydrogenase dimerization domain-containing protein, partial [Mycobacteriales bacterium]